jgi:hypothetical protein
MTKDDLVILSLPFQRLIRSHLTPMVLEILTKRADVIIVSPFAMHSDFVNQYQGDRIGHALAPTHEGLPWLFKKLVAVSSSLRLRGYWCRNRKRLPYYWSTRHIGFGENGNDTVSSPSKRVIMDILACIGLYPRAWVLLDSLIGRWSYHMLELSAIVRQYDHVTLIQAASWGFQDQALAWMGRKYQWRTVLLPYTTDQLMTNGYLYSNFDAICVQGTTERRFAQVLHEVPTSRVINLGSTYIKTLKAISPVNSANELGSRPPKLKVMYAGLVSTYFPVECEIQAVNTLSELKINDDMHNLDIVYRPVGYSKDSVEWIRRQLKFPKRVEMQFPSHTSIGLAAYSPANSTSDLRRLLQDLAGIAIIVTSLTTSLSIEAALLQIPTICYYPLDNFFLQKRKLVSTLNNESRVIGFESVPVARSLEELVSMLGRLIANADMRRKISEATLCEWDYPESDYESLLNTAVFGNA